jgi:multiple sugar transport system permease protein
MKTRSFLSFVAPSVVLMLALMAVPLLLTFYLSTRHCAPEMEMVTVRQSGPFGTQETVTQQVRKGPDGQPLQSCRFVGLEYYQKVLGLDRGAVLQDSGNTGESSSSGATQGSGRAGKPAAVANEFWSALRFTLLYIALTTPLVLGLGFALALGASVLTQRLKAVFITASLLPFIITPVVGALSIKWLFRDDGLVAGAAQLEHDPACVVVPNPPAAQMGPQIRRHPEGQLAAVDDATAPGHGGRQLGPDAPVDLPELRHGPGAVEVGGNHA